MTFKNEIQFDVENYLIKIPAAEAGKEDVSIAVFDKVTVQVEVEKDKNTQRGKVKMMLVKPANARLPS